VLGRSAMIYGLEINDYQKSQKNYITGGRSSFRSAATWPRFGSCILF